MSAPNGTPVCLKVCITCDRHAAIQGSIGGDLADALEALSQEMIADGHLRIRRVSCLSGCKHPGNIELGTPAKGHIRIDQLRAYHAADLIELAEKFATSPTGDIPQEDWPPDIRGHLAACVKPQTQSA